LVMSIGLTNNSWFVRRNGLAFCILCSDKNIKSKPGFKKKEVT